MPSSGCDKSGRRMGISILGNQQDIVGVELLATSLLVQTDRAMLAHGRRTSRTAAFRRSFVVSYAQRIGERLRAASEGALADSGRAHELLPGASRARRTCQGVAGSAVSGDHAACSTGVGRAGLGTGSSCCRFGSTRRPPCRDPVTGCQADREFLPARIICVTRYRLTPSRRAISSGRMPCSL